MTLSGQQIQMTKGQRYVSNLGIWVTAHMVGCANSHIIHSPHEIISTVFNFPY